MLATVGLGPGGRRGAHCAGGRVAERSLERGVSARREREAAVKRAVTNEPARVRGRPLEYEFLVSRARRGVPQAQP